MNLIQGIADLGVHGLGKAIELIGPIQREPGDGVLNGKQNMLVGHRSLFLGVITALYNTEAIGNKC